MSDGEKNAADIDIIRIALTANSFRERLADLCHAQWSGWMRYMLGDCSSDVCRAVAGPDGEVPKPKIDHTEYRQRWQRQMSTPYAELSDSEQASDRKEADRFIALIATGLNDAAELIQKRVIGIADKAIAHTDASFANRFINAEGNYGPHEAQVYGADQMRTDGDRIAALTRKLATAREVLIELLRLYDWRNEVGGAITDDEAKKYGREKKAAWIAARKALLDMGDGDENCGCTMFDWCPKHIAAIDAPTGEGVIEPESIPPRVIDGKFMAAVQEGTGRRAVVIVKISSGEIVPEDEPLVLMRARDHLMVATLNHYRRLCQLDGCNDYQLGLVDELIAKFTTYASDPSRMKQPGITRGAAWTPTTIIATCPNCGEQFASPVSMNPHWIEGIGHRGEWKCGKPSPPPEPASNLPASQMTAHDGVAVSELSSAPPLTAEERAHCVDCGMLYGGDEWLDLTLPDDQWELIQSSDKENGILCANCIVKRASKVPRAGAIRAVISIALQMDRGDALERAAARILSVLDSWSDDTDLPRLAYPVDRAIIDDLRTELARAKENR